MRPSRQRSWMSDDELGPALGHMHEQLVRDGLLAPVELGGAEERAWLACDLASLAENRLGEVLDALPLDEARRTDWLTRATTERTWGLAERSEHERCYWILDGRERAGTVALASELFGRSSVGLSSLYMMPALRRRGIGRRVLERVREALRPHGLGLRLETCWAWQRTVKFYLASGLWVGMWKRDLELTWDPKTPNPRIDVGDDEASLSVHVDGEELVLARARRRGSALVLDEPEETLARDERLGNAHWRAMSTLSLALALRGWPLIRSPETWERHRIADAGPPEALAHRITAWEAWDRAHGWVVETPRIPGLDYPTWAALEAEWKRVDDAGVLK